MGVLDQVIQMRNQGMADRDIYSQLQEQGISPKSINDALSQANIKVAVGNGSFENSEMTPSDIPSPSQNQGEEDAYSPPSEHSEYPYSQQMYSQSAQQEFYPQQGQEGGYYEGASADTMVEIAQQVFSERIKKIQQQMDGINEFISLYRSKTDSMSERVKRIEGMIDRLQSAILEKVGDYGKGMESIRKELSMMQDSFGKVVNTVIDKKEDFSRHRASSYENPENQETEVQQQYQKPAQQHEQKAIQKKKKR